MTNKSVIFGITVNITNGICDIDNTQTNATRLGDEGCQTLKQRPLISGEAALQPLLMTHRMIFKSSPVPRAAYAQILGNVHVFFLEKILRIQQSQSLLSIESFFFEKAAIHLDELSDERLKSMGGCLPINGPFRFLN